mmetsp:Transcript_13791/g.22935  ORF Transcript_13791/g.22935 Transcript_13791/m.22935 type:complete len:110 (-) Transcript_13791:215-544(-)
MLRSYTVFDVTINALALYFNLEADDDLVDDEDMNSIRHYQKEQLNVIQSKQASEFKHGRSPGGNEECTNTWEESIRAQYFSMVSHGASSLANGSHLDDSRALRVGLDRG